MAMTLRALKAIRNLSESMRGMISTIQSTPNINGSRKFTAYMGKYLSDNYRLNADHSPEIQSAWGECARRADKVISACAKGYGSESGQSLF